MFAPMPRSRSGTLLVGWGGSRGKIEPDKVPLPRRGEESAAGVEAGGLFSGEVLLLPEHVGAGQGRMAAEVDLHGRGKPAEVEAIGPPYQKSSLGQIHLPSHLLHP